jgi:hypothetical protein
MSTSSFGRTRAPDDAGETKMSDLYHRLDQCDHEIQKARAEDKRLHTTAEHAGILLWEIDSRLTRAMILAEIATERQLR